MSTIFPYVPVIIIMSFLIIYTLKRKLQKVAVAKLSESSVDIHNEQPVTYAINILGLTNEYDIDILQPIVVFENRTTVKLTKVLFPRINWKRQPALQKWKFKAHEKGTYTITFPNSEKFVLENPTLTSKKVFSDRKIFTKDLMILITK
ncbi:hypothetical protein [Kordia jejudonensis]|uniref:hypothetical protein n=1 Tax=Kordia jejudonensis TaxID=1348245 RepID=UPI000629112B|nr:hypothetical protein [Kordia jejudonensis]